MEYSLEANSIYIQFLEKLRTKIQLAFSFCLEQEIYVRFNIYYVVEKCFCRYGHFSGINRKVQIKAMDDKRNYDMLTKFKGRNKNSQISVGNSQALLLILKWGGELTPMGKKEAEELGRAFRCVYPGGQGWFVFVTAK